jgi:hypothetical protein
MSQDGKTARRKPTGEPAFLSIRPAGEPAGEVIVTTLQLPSDKQAIEAWVMELALKSGPPGSACDLQWLYGFRAGNQNVDENHFDFTLETEGGEEYLDLMEAAPLQKFGGSYANVPLSRNQGEVADEVYEEIRAKSRHYGLPQRIPVHLLVYSADRRCDLSVDTAKLVGLRARSGDHGFATIVYFSLLADSGGVLHWIFPREDEFFADLNENLARSTSYRTLDLTDPEDVATLLAIRSEVLPIIRGASAEPGDPANG